MNLFIAVLLPVFAGTAFVRWFAGGPEEMPFTEALVYGLGVGTGLLTYEMFLSEIAGLPFSLHVSSAFLLVFGVFFVFLSFRHLRSREMPLKPRGEKISGVRLWVTVFYLYGYL